MLVWHNNGRQWPSAGGMAKVAASAQCESHAGSAKAVGHRFGVMSGGS